MTCAMPRVACGSRTLAACVLASAATVAPLRAEPIAGWPQPGGPNSPVTITYSYSNLLDGSFLVITPTELRAATEEALGLWARYAPLNFVEEIDSGPPPSQLSYDPAGHPQIRIGHEAMSQLALTFFPSSTDGLAGDIHLDSGIPWTAGAGHWNVLEALVHELGHALGLPHELNEIAMMNPSYPQQRYGELGTAFLFPADIAAIRSVYGNGEGSVQPLATTPEPGTLLLVGSTLAGMAAARVRRQRFRWLVTPRLRGIKRPSV